MGFFKKERILMGFVKGFCFCVLQEEKKSLKEKLQAVQEVTLTVQTAIGTLASLLESVKK